MAIFTATQLVAVLLAFGIKALSTDIRQLLNCLEILAMPDISFKSLFLISALFRVFLILYGEWQDAHMEVRYTDVDYFVFSDAATLMASGRSPYERATYRYSPLIAFLLMPNLFIHHSWGKFLFSASGMLCLVMNKLLVSHMAI